MPSAPRLTAADAETLLVSAGFAFLERRGHHRIYGRTRTRVVVPFDGRPELHPKIVRMIVESVERSRPATSFEVDKSMAGLGQGVANDAGAWVAEPGEPVLKIDLGGPTVAPPAPKPAAKSAAQTAARPVAKPLDPKPVAPKAAAPKAPAPAPMPTPAPAETLVIPSPAADDGSDPEDDINLPRKPKGAWS
ncbi:MAG TPA: type II toxin-antitoxin system HicA family toxin [bacterium]